VSGFLWNWWSWREFKHILKYLILLAFYQKNKSKEYKQEYINFYKRKQKPYVQL